MDSLKPHTFKLHLALSFLFTNQIAKFSMEFLSSSFKFKSHFLSVTSLNTVKYILFSSQNSYSPNYNIFKFHGNIKIPSQKHKLSSPHSNRPWNISYFPFSFVIFSCFLWKKKYFSYKKEWEVPERKKLFDMQEVFLSDYYERKIKKKQEFHCDVKLFFVRMKRKKSLPRIPCRDTKRPKM